MKKKIVDVGNFVVNNSKLRSLGWKPKMNLDEGIKKLLSILNHKKSVNHIIFFDITTK